MLTAWALAVLGGFFAVAGAQLASLGGSPYYVIAGIAMIVSGAMIGRGIAGGRTLYLLIWAATVVWAIWEVGLQPLWLVPRVVAPTRVNGARSSGIDVAPAPLPTMMSMRKSSIAR